MIFFTILVFSYPKPTTNSQEITNVDGGVVDGLRQPPVSSYLP